MKDIREVTTPSVKLPPPEKWDDETEIRRLREARKKSGEQALKLGERAKRLEERAKHKV